MWFKTAPAVKVSVPSYKMAAQMSALAFWDLVCFRFQDPLTLHSDPRGRRCNRGKINLMRMPVDRCARAGSLV